MNDADKNRQEIQAAIKRKFTERITQALAKRDCAQAGMTMPEKDHELWNAWNGGAKAVVEELDRELSALLDYESTINWMTTCTSCAVTLESSYRETVRRELVELTLKEVAEWAHATRHGNAAGEVLNILKKGERRRDKELKGEGDS